MLLARDPDTKARPGRPRDEAQWRKRREEILVASALLFAEAGFRQTDLKRVADHLGLAKGTLYNYFSSKEELFFAAVDHGLEQLSGCLADVHSVHPQEQLRLKIEAYLGFFAEHRHIFELFLQERAEFKDLRGDGAALERCRLIVQSWFAEEENLAGLSADGLSTLLLGLCLQPRSLCGLLAGNLCRSWDWLLEPVK